MSVARITEISSTSTKSFEDALQQGVARATKTLRNVRSAWVKEQQVTATRSPSTRSTCSCRSCSKTAIRAELAAPVPRPSRPATG
jgi:flavin-binding protein dodecin